VNLSKGFLRRLFKRSAKQIRGEEKAPEEKKASVPRTMPKEAVPTQKPAPKVERVTEAPKPVQRPKIIYSEEEVTVPIKVIGKEVYVEGTGRKKSLPVKVISKEDLEEETKFYKFAGPQPEPGKEKDKSKQPKIEKTSLMVEFPHVTEELRSKGFLPTIVEKGGVRGAPVGMAIPKEGSGRISSEWEPPKVSEVDIKYPLIDPYAYATIRWDEGQGELVYTLIEPPLTKKEQQTLEKIRDLIVDLLDINLMDIKNIKEVQKYLKGKLNQIIADYEIVVNEAEYNKILYYIYRNFLGLEKIEPLMQDPNIEDISCDGVNIPIFVYHRKYGSLKSNIMFTESEEVNKFITKLAQRTGKHISVAEPLLDGALPDGSRLQATFSTGGDIAMRGSTFTIRKFTKDPLTIIDFMNYGTIPAKIAAYLWIALEFRNSILISGGTATGKTSALNALSLFLHPEAKIVSIEDTPEIRLPHEHWIAKVARSGYGGETEEGKRRGEISMFDLLKAALRERPDELIVGEVRGAEAYVLFQGMATGHAGLATIHAESVEAVINRLKTAPINLSAGLLQHLDIILIMGFSRIKGIDVRRIKEVAEVIGVDIKTGKPITNVLFKWIPAGDYFEFSSDQSYVLNKIVEEKGIGEASIWQELDRRANVLEWMKKQNIRYFEDVGRIVATYYKDPQEVLSKIGGA
jgi:flagellar protein FlaI